MYLNWELKITMQQAPKGLFLGLKTSLVATKLSQFTYPTMIFFCVLHKSVWACRFVCVILNRPKQYLLHLSITDVWASCTDQHLQVGCRCPRLSHGCVFDGCDLGQIRG